MEAFILFLIFVTFLQISAKLQELETKLDNNLNITIKTDEDE